MGTDITEQLKKTPDLKVGDANPPTEPDVNINGPLQQMFGNIDLSDENPVQDSDLPDAFIFALKETTGKKTMEATEPLLNVHKWAKSMLTRSDGNVGQPLADVRGMFTDRVQTRFFTSWWKTTEPTKRLAIVSMTTTVTVQRLKETGLLKELRDLADENIVCEVPKFNGMKTQLDDTVQLKAWHAQSGTNHWWNKVETILKKPMFYNQIVPGSAYDGEVTVKDTKWALEGKFDVWEMDKTGKVIGQTATLLNVNLSENIDALNNLVSQPFRYYQGVPKRITKLRTSQDAGNWGYYEPRFLRLFYRVHKDTVVEFLSGIPSVAGYSQVFTKLPYETPEPNIPPIKLTPSKVLGFELSKFSQTFIAVHKKGDSFDATVQKLGNAALKRTNYSNFNEIYSELVNFGSQFVPQIKTLAPALSAGASGYSLYDKFKSRDLFKPGVKTAVVEFVNSLYKMIGYAVIAFIMGDTLRCTYVDKLKSGSIKSLVQHHPSYPTVAFVRGTTPPSLDIGTLREWGSNLTVATGAATEFYNAQVTAVTQWLKSKPDITDVVGHSRGAGIAYNAIMAVNKDYPNRALKFCGLDGAMTLATTWEGLQPNSLMSRNINMASALDSTLDPKGAQERVNAITNDDNSSDDASISGIVINQAKMIGELLGHSDAVSQIGTSFDGIMGVVNRGVGHDAGTSGTRYNSATIAAIETGGKFKNPIDGKVKYTLVATGFKHGDSVREGTWPKRTRRGGSGMKPQGNGHYSNLYWDQKSGDFMYK